MKRLLAANVAMLALAGCGGGSNAVGANSSESTEITAVGNVVANEATSSPTPTASTTPADAAMGNDTAAVTADTASNAATDDSATATDDSATATDDHPGDDTGDTVRQN